MEVFMRMSSINGEMSVAIFDDQREISVTDEANVLEKQSSKFRWVPSYLKASEVLVPIARYVAWDVYHFNSLGDACGSEHNMLFVWAMFPWFSIWAYMGISWNIMVQTFPNTEVPRFHVEFHRGHQILSSKVLPWSGHRAEPRHRWEVMGDQHFG